MILSIVAGDRKFTNKTLRQMVILRMAKAQIPTDKAMLVTRHHDVKSYNQYNTNSIKLQMDTYQCIISGNGKKYLEVLSQELRKANNVKVIYLRLNYLDFCFCFLFFIEYFNKFSLLLCKISKSVRLQVSSVQVSRPQVKF